MLSTPSAFAVGGPKEGQFLGIFLPMITAVFGVTWIVEVRDIQNGNTVAINMITQQIFDLGSKCGIGRW